MTETTAAITDAEGTATDDPSTDEVDDVSSEDAGSLEIDASSETDATPVNDASEEGGGLTAKLAPSGGGASGNQGNGSGG